MTQQTQGMAKRNVVLAIFHHQNKRNDIKRE